MGTYKQIFYQIVFSTKHREATITEDNESELYRYIWGIIKGQKCMLYQINSMPDHIHLFSDLHPSVCLSDYIKNIKVASSIWMKNNGKPSIHRLAGRLRGFYLFSKGKGYDNRVYKEAERTPSKGNVL
jgi:REP element-mobilizing transposase RayT